MVFLNSWENKTNKTNMTSKKDIKPEMYAYSCDPCT